MKGCNHTEKFDIGYELTIYIHSELFIHDIKCVNNENNSSLVLFVGIVLNSNWSFFIYI